jgi:exodeoxyribonuclease V beta subunit
MDPERPGQGVYADCPDPDFLAALGDALFADGPET